jgi:hypothetical protein
LIDSFFIFVQTKYVNMKRLLFLSLLAALAISCSKEENLDTNQNSSDLTALVNTNIYGTYTGIFSTLDSEFRGVIDVVIPVNGSDLFKFNAPTAILTLENGKTIKVTSFQEPMSGQAISNMVFENTELSLLYSVDANGANPRISNVVFNNVDADIRIAKNRIGKAPVNPLTGTFSCSDCKGHPNLTNNTEYTFSLMFTTGDDGNKTDVVSQIIIPGAANSPYGSIDNTQGPVATGTSRMLSLVSGTDIGSDLNWNGSYLKSNSESCNAAIGTWSLNSAAVGEIIEGVFSSTNADDCKEVFINANFNTFAGAGFGPSPVVGQIDSDFIIFSGFSDGDMNYGDTKTTGDYNRGIANVGVSIGGIYAGVITPGDRCLLIQPVEDDFTPGTVTVRILNDGGLDFTNVQVQADVVMRNDQPRSTSISLEYSTDNITFTPVPGVSTINTPLAATGSTIVLATSFDRAIPVSLADNAFIYLRVLSDDNGGTGNRDEIGIDNLKVLAY